MKTRILVLIVAGICGAITLTGCDSLPSRRSSDTGEPVHVEKQLDVATTLRFDDIPTPAGFNNLRDQSFVFQDSSIRVGLLRYAGRPNANQVAIFFKTQMTLYNWELENTVEHGIATMYFTKGEETCVITIEPLTTKTVVNIVISPKKGRMSTGIGSKKDRY